MKEFTNIKSLGNLIKQWYVLYALYAIVLLTVLQYTKDHKTCLHCIMNKTIKTPVFIFKIYFDRILI